MLCYHCNAKPVCTIYNNLSKHMDTTTIVVEDCVHYFDSNEQPKIDKVSYPSSPKVHHAGFQLLNSNLKDYKDFNQNKKEDKEDRKNYYMCSFCESNKTEKYRCEDCGVEICENCANLDAFTGKKYCDYCWEKK